MYLFLETLAPSSKLGSKSGLLLNITVAFGVLGAAGR